MDGQSIDRLIMAKISVLWRDNCCIHNRTYKSTEFCVRRFDDVFLVRIFASREFYWLFEYAVVTLAVFICFVFHWLNSNLIRYNSYTFLPFMDFQFFFFLNSLKTNYFVINFSFHIFSALFSIHKYHWKLSLSNKIQIQQFKKWIFALFNTLFWTTDDKKSTATTYNSNVSIQNVSKIIQKSRDL